MKATGSTSCLALRSRRLVRPYDDQVLLKACAYTRERHVFGNIFFCRIDKAGRMNQDACQWLKVSQEVTKVLPLMPQHHSAYVLRNTPNSRQLHAGSCDMEAVFSAPFSISIPTSHRRVHALGVRISITPDLPTMYPLTLDRRGSDQT